MVGSSCIPAGSSPYLPNTSASDVRLSDVRNKDVLIWVGDKLLPRELAKVSVFDSAVQVGERRAGKKCRLDSDFNL